MFLWNIAVTSLAEVWIEMQKVERIRYLIQVTSLAEVWIEIEFMTEAGQLNQRHFPCGSVD